MSKTFKGFASDRELTVKGYDDGSQVDLLVRRSPTGFGVTGIAIAPSDSAALMLAIGEAAYPDVQGRPNWVHCAIGALLEQVEEDGFKADEARDRAKLEAEALELCNAHRTAVGSPTVASWDGFTSATKSNWLAVARCARELAKEATK